MLEQEIPKYSQIRTLGFAIISSVATTTHKTIIYLDCKTLGILSLNWNKDRSLTLALKMILKLHWIKLL